MATAPSLATAGMAKATGKEVFIPNITEERLTTRKNGCNRAEQSTRSTARTFI
jgi:hypothetical protein